MTDTKRRGFTLIEMLAVIAIMGIVAALVISMAGAASTARKKGQVDAEKNRLMMAIESYQSKLSFYPPDNGALATTNLLNYDSTAAANPLLYELTGVTNLKTSLGVSTATYSAFYGSNFTINAMIASFNRGGIANSDTSEPQNFLNPLPLPKDYTNCPAKNSGVCALIVPVPLTNGVANFWHYDSSSPYRHNPNSYDLWAEYATGSKNGQLTIITNGNW